MAPILDFDCTAPARLEAVAALNRIYPRHSLKRAAARAVNAANLLTLRRRPPALGSVPAVLWDRAGVQEDGYAAILLHKLHQNGRIYVFGFGSDGSIQTVSKIGMTPASRVGIDREREVLQRLDGVALPFEIPRVLDYHSTEEASVLCMTATGDRRRQNRTLTDLSDDVYDSIAALRPSDAPSELRIGAFGWFESARAAVAEPRLRAVAESLSPEEMMVVSAAHRDLGPENIVSWPSTESRRRIGIIDWEYFTETAPAMTDRVGAWLGTHHRHFKGTLSARPVSSLAGHFIRTFDGAGELRSATVALLGLQNMGNDLARRLCGARP